ncbi:MAG: hypothetical protein WC256_05655 [Desulfurivibrionaceae bacterium]
MNAKTQGLLDGYSDFSGCGRIIHPCDTGGKYDKKIINCTGTDMEPRHHEQRQEREIGIEPWNNGRGAQSYPASRDYRYINEPPAGMIQCRVADDFHQNKNTPAQKHRSGKSFFPGVNINLKGREFGKFSNCTETDRHNNKRKDQEKYQMA